MGIPRTARGSVGIGVGVWAGFPGNVVGSKAGEHGQLENLHPSTGTGEKIAKS